MSTGLLWLRPRLGWRASSQDLYTVVLIDTGIEALEVGDLLYKDGDILCPGSTLVGRGKE